MSCGTRKVCLLLKFTPTVLSGLLKNNPVSTKKGWDLLGREAQLNATGLASVRCFPFRDVSQSGRQPVPGSLGLLSRAQHKLELSWGRVCCHLSWLSWFLFFSTCFFTVYNSGIFVWGVSLSRSSWPAGLPLGHSRIRAGIERRASLKLKILQFL